MAIVKKKNAKTGITYVYESHSVWIPELKQPRATTKIIGKLDPQTGEVIPTGPRGRPRSAQKETVSKDGAGEAALKKELYEVTEQKNKLEIEFKKLQADYNRMRDVLVSTARKIEGLNLTAE